MKILLYLFIADFFVFTISHASLIPDDSGKKLMSFYLGLNVENLWLPGSHINWETGWPDSSGYKAHTHCSAFVAAACERLGIYILQPPQHSQVLLANAQEEWLGTADAAEKGWKRIDDSHIYLTAQDFSNRGYVVTAVIRGRGEKKSGHIALVMPAEMTPEKLESGGPLVIMAGERNYNSISLKRGFRYHIDAWPESLIRFYVNLNEPKFP